MVKILKKGKCVSCGFYLTKLSFEKDGEYVVKSLNEKDYICILRNEVKKTDDGCRRYYTKKSEAVPAEKRLEFHNMHKGRFYESLAFFTSLIAIIISLSAIFLT